MSFLKRIINFFKPKHDVQIIPSREEFYPPSKEILRCSIGCTGLDCKHNFNPDRMVEKEVVSSDGTVLKVQGKEYVGEPPYYTERESITVEEIWPQKPPSRYRIKVPEVAVERPPVWIEGQNPYPLGDLPDEIKVPEDKIWSPFSGGLIDKPHYVMVKVNKEPEFKITKSMSEISSGNEFAEQIDDDIFWVIDDAEGE